MFTAKWKKEAKLVAKGALKFVNYKRDLLAVGRVEEIESRRKDLLAAVSANEKSKADEATKQLQAACNQSLPREKPPNWLEENVEVFFVSIVIALGLRAYFLQPFRIPTGSMQPTLNGIIGTPLAEKDWPSLPVRWLNYVLRGREYVKIVNDRDRHAVGMSDFQSMHFFSRSQITFSDSAALTLPAPLAPMAEISNVLKGLGTGKLLPKGAVIAEGTIDSGDLVLVDKISYHFRKPKRGEVYVFDTRGIRGIQERSPDQGTTHYIKRLVGVPGDVLSVNPPNIFINGKIPQESGIRRVMDGTPPFKTGGYELAQAEQLRPDYAHFTRYLVKPTDSLTLRLDAEKGMREYAAFGDNTRNSLDSRYWGTVKEHNVVGPALFALWPITTGHWGFIR